MFTDQNSVRISHIPTHHKLLDFINQKHVVKKTNYALK